MPAMDEVPQQSVICTVVLHKRAPMAIHEELVATLGNNVLAYVTVKKWAALFKAGRESVEEDPCSGRPLVALTEEDVNNVE